MLTEKSPCNNLENRNLSSIIADSIPPKEAMLPERSPFDDLEVAYQMILVAIQTETPQITRTQLLPENSPFNDLEQRKLTGIIADSVLPKEVMLPERSPFNDLEAGHRMLVSTHPETPQITGTQVLHEKSPFNDLEERKLYWIIAKPIPPNEAMLPENSTFNDLEAGHLKLVAIHPETPQVTRTDDS